MQEQTTQPNFADLLATVTTEPGTLSAAYTAFHDYSLGNQILAFCQLRDRGIPLGPIASFHRWHDLGRHVCKGQKAITLCMPITCKRQDEATGEPATFTRFVYKRNWFALAQTEGAEYEAPAPPAWEKTRALAALDVTEVPFEMLDGNTQGYAIPGRKLAINPVAANPFKTLFHELAHIVIGHTGEDTTDDPNAPRQIKELEAEATAMLVCAALGLPGLEESRGYVQNWIGKGAEIPDGCARRIFKAADAILKAGRATDDDEPQPPLPGAEQVRETENPTPTFEAPFSLAAEPSTASRGTQPDLF